MSPNNRVLFNGALRPKLLNIPFSSCSFMNLYFLLPDTAHFDDDTVLPFLVFTTFESTFFVLFCTLNNMSICFIIVNIWKV